MHKETIAVAIAESDGGEVRYFGEITNTPQAVEKLVSQIRKGGAQLSFCYEVRVRLRHPPAIERTGLGLPGGGTIADPEDIFVAPRQAL